VRNGELGLENERGGLAQPTVKAPYPSERLLCTEPTARRVAAEASGKRQPGNNNCDKRLREANLIIARPRITPELSRPAREPAWKIEATKRVRLE
jgi:hypothetical protein